MGKNKKDAEKYKMPFADINKKIRDTINKYGMLCKTKSVLCAYSGGADSTAMLYIMNCLKEEYSLEISALHINHMIRGDEADRDELHCVRFCDYNNIPLIVKHVDIPSICLSEHLGTEEAARRERYKIFSDLCKEKGFDKVCVAHNSDDNMETVIFNMTRGSGIDGLCGIPPVRDNIIRPLLETSREEILEFIKIQKLEYITDSSNNEDIYTRNYIRHNIIPHLYKLNPAAGEAYTKMCGRLRLDAEFIKKAAEGNYESDSEVLLSRRIIAEYEKFPDCTSLEYVHVKSAVELIKHGKIWGKISFPSGIDFVKTRSGFELQRRKEEKEDLKKKLYKELLPGENELGDYGTIYLTVVKKNFEDYINIYKSAIKACFDSDRINGMLYAKSREAGDVITLSSGTRTIKKLFNDKKIPISKRKVLPFICDSRGILWIPETAIRNESAYDLKKDNGKCVYMAYIQQQTI